MRVGMIDTQAIRQRWECVGSRLDERGRRVFAAGEARAAGWGGLAAFSAMTGLARSTIGRGLKDLDAAPLPKGRERRKGGGRRHLSSRDATLIEDLRSVIEPATLGDPMRPLLWVSKSHDKVADALQKQGHEISASSVKRLLPTLGYSRQSNRKADEGSKHPDRNAQFEHINAKAIAAQAAGQPVISVDTKKKELIGNYKKWWHRLSPERRSAAREGARLRGQGARQGRALWRVRRWRQCRVGERRDHKRHGSVCRRLHPPLARRDGARALPESPRVDHHGRWRWLEWNACPAVESRVAKARRPDRPHAPPHSLSAGHVEVEQDRAPPVLPHHADLARATTRRSHGRGRADCCDDHQSWPESRERPRYRNL